MIIQCKSCSRKFIVKDSDISEKGRNVQCGYCSAVWHQMPNLLGAKKIKTKKTISKKEEPLSVDSIKASDGRTYKFLGSQWAQLLPSGKTGIFAKKKIGKELDKLTGRKIESGLEKEKKKSKKNLDPSSESLSSEKRLPDIYIAKEGMGFFGYIFLLIIVAFSLIGILKTFETDLINNFPEIEYIFEILDEQLIYVSESVKNIITITTDLINSY
tara:strand:- start:203 stop:844 length:642 start_codon:yes stop_codon:yes gene_type:complete